MEKESKKNNLKVIISVIILILILAIIILCMMPKLNKMSKEEMLEIAIDYSGVDETNHRKTNKFFLDLSDNLSKAEEQVGKVFKVEEYVDNIQQDYCEFDYTAVKVGLYLASEDLANLKKDSKICVVGKLTDIQQNKKFMMGFDYEELVFEIRNCYLVEE